MNGEVIAGLAVGVAAFMGMTATSVWTVARLSTRMESLTNAIKALSKELHTVKDMQNQQLERLIRVENKVGNE